MSPITTLILVGALVATSSAEAIAQTKTVTPTSQSAVGPCPINISNVSGTVHIHSTCFDERILKPFLDIINRQNRNFDEKSREVEGWIKRYFELSERLGVPGAYATLRAEAREKFRANDLRGALDTKLKIAEKEEAIVSQLAADYFDIGELLVLQFSPTEAQTYYAKAFRLEPQTPKYSEAYARSLCDANQRAKAAQVYEVSIAELRTLVKSDPSRYAGDLTCTLVDLVGLHFGSADYPRAFAVAQEALEVAKSITPSDTQGAREHLANALVAVGITQAKLGDTKSARVQLMEAEQIYGEINVTNFNRPAVAEALADIAKEESDRIVEEEKRRRAFELQKEVLAKSPYGQRLRLANFAYELANFYRIGGVPDKAMLVEQELAESRSMVPPNDSVTASFLAAAGATIRADLFLWRGDLESAQKHIEESFVTFSTIQAHLKQKETNWTSRAHSIGGWVQVRRGNYTKAISNFDDAIKVNLHGDGEQMRRARRDRRLAEFFVAEFGAAAREVLAHSDTLDRFDRGLWEFIVERRTNSGAGPGPVSMAGSDQFTQLIFTALNAVEAKPLLAQAKVLADEETEPELKCKRYFFVAQAMLLTGNKADGVRTLSLCVAERYDYFYPWIMKAERDYWAKDSRR